MVRYSNGGLKTRQKKACLWSKMSCIWMVRKVMWLYHLNNWHPYCPVFRWIRYSDGYSSIALGFVLLCVHRKRDAFSYYLYLLPYQSSTPLPLTNFIIHPLCFHTAYKSYDMLPVLAGMSDSKNPDLYYCYCIYLIQIHFLLCARCYFLFI